jgi:hypothetical protein
MSLSSMSSREKIVVAVLGAVILLALIGIGILAANLVSRTDEEQGVAGESATAAVGEEEGQPAGSTEGVTGEAGAPEVAADITPVATPMLREPPPPAPDAAGGQVVVRQEGLGGLAPVVIADQALQPGRRYRIEIQAVDGSRVEIHGSWSQAAVDAGGTLSAPTIEFFEGQTPYAIDLALPLADPSRWSCSVSAAYKIAPLGSGQEAQLSGPALAIEILDVTGSQ